MLECVNSYWILLQARCMIGVFSNVKINDFGAFRSAFSRFLSDAVETVETPTGAHDPDPGRRRRIMPRLSEGGGAQREAAQ